MNWDGMEWSGRESGFSFLFPFNGNRSRQPTNKESQPNNKTQRTDDCEVNDDWPRLDAEQEDRESTEYTRMYANGGTSQTSSVQRTMGSGAQIAYWVIRLASIAIFKSSSSISPLTLNARANAISSDSLAPMPVPPVR